LHDQLLTTIKDENEKNSITSVAANDFILKGQDDSSDAHLDS